MPKTKHWDSERKTQTKFSFKSTRSQSKLLCEFRLFFSLVFIFCKLILRKSLRRVRTSCLLEYQWICIIFVSKQDKVIVQTWVHRFALFIAFQRHIFQIGSRQSLACLFSLSLSLSLCCRSNANIFWSTLNTLNSDNNYTTTDTSSSSVYFFYVTRDWSPCSIDLPDFNSNLLFFDFISLWNLTPNDLYPFEQMKQRQFNWRMNRTK